jgi:hypothetical protein
VQPAQQRVLAVRRAQAHEQIGQLGL